MIPRREGLEVKKSRREVGWERRMEGRMEGRERKEGGIF